MNNLCWWANGTSQDKAEADWSGLRVLEEMLREADPREQETEDRAVGAAVAETGFPVLRGAPQGGAAKSVLLVREDGGRRREEQEQSSFLSLSIS